VTEPNPNTAEAILQRLLVVLPLAAREGGSGIDPLARALGVDGRRLFRDLQELEGRSYYLPAGLGDQIQLSLTREHLEVWTTGEFQRPVRLTPREALALELGLRTVARSGEEGDRTAFEALRERTVTALRTPTPDDAEDPAIALGSAEAGEDHLRSRIEDAVRNGRILRIRYHPPGKAESVRSVAPLVLAHAEGHWYLLARDIERDGARAFRLDRMSEAEPSHTRFAPDPRDGEVVDRFLRDGRVHDGGGPDAPEPFDAVVHYSSSIARWIRERGWPETEVQDDGSIRVRHRVVDPEWLWRQVLSYGGAAWIVEPAWARERLVERLRFRFGSDPTVPVSHSPEPLAPAGPTDPAGEPPGP
jgi:predicted DNA-binding transcriptional regulator YafY